MNNKTNIENIKVGELFSWISSDDSSYAVRKITNDICIYLNETSVNYYRIGLGNLTKIINKDVYRKNKDLFINKISLLKIIQNIKKNI